MALVESLKLEIKPKPTRRVWIPKPGKDEKRPLGIPTIRDRALQALTKMALEPEWEAKFEPNSYGFRPGRSCHDAIEAIFNAIRYKSKFVLDADIANCFDRINHKALMDKMETSPTIRRQIRGWLKSGVIDGRSFNPSKAGTPQGGVISPLLANIALHGLENDIKQELLPYLPKQKGWGLKARLKSLSIIRYADDFVILYEQKEVIDRARTVVEKWLDPMGLGLKDAKTRISHTLEKEGA